MARIKESVIIEAPLAKVFAFAKDWRNLKRYFVYVLDVKPTTEKTVGEGAQLSLRVKVQGRMMDSEWKGIEYIEKVGWAYSATLMGREGIKRWRFVPVNGSTKVTFTFEYKIEPPLIGHLLNVIMIRPYWRKLYKQSFRELKRLIESEKAAVPSS